MSNQIFASCPNDLTDHTVSAKHAGKVMKCKSCGQPFRIPENQHKIPDAASPAASSFTKTQVQNQSSPAVIQDQPPTNTAAAGSQAINIIFNSAGPQQQTRSILEPIEEVGPDYRPVPSKNITILLWFFIGGCGVHRWYLNSKFGSKPIDKNWAMAYLVSLFLVVVTGGFWLLLHVPMLLADGVVLICDKRDWE